MSYFGDDDDFNNDETRNLSDDEESTIVSSDEDVEDIGEPNLNENENEEDIADVEDVVDSDDEDMSQYGGADDSDLEEGEIDEEGEAKQKRTKKIPPKTMYKKKEGEEDEDDDEEDDDGEQYLQKFDKDINENYIVNFHPECISQNYDEILSMVKVVRDMNGIIVDDLHQTIPFLTKYERARILGQRAKQINSGAQPFIKVPENIIDGYIIAEMELKEKRIPFIIRRPLPNGGSEYWSIKDLEDIAF